MRSYTELHALEPALLRSLDAVPNNLPGQLSSFVGRERELEELRPALGATRADADGAGGSGKTRLALVLASESLEKYLDGVWWIDLAAQADPAMVGDAIAEAIGVRPLPGMTPVQALSGAPGTRPNAQCLTTASTCSKRAEAATAILESCLGDGPGDEPGAAGGAG